MEGHEAGRWELGLVLKAGQILEVSVLDGLDLFSLVVALGE